MRRGRITVEPESSTYPVDALLTARARFHLGYRLTARTLQLLSPDGGARTTPWRLLLVAFVGLDLAIWAVLRKPDRVGLKTRLVLDSGDIALWSLAPYPAGTPYVLAVLVGFPLALETGLRRRLVGLVVPAVTMITTVAVRSLVGVPAMPQQFVWLVVAAGWGILLRRYVGRLRRQAEDEWGRQSSAEHRRAFLAGQNSVAMGASSAVDTIEGVLPVLGEPEAGSVMWDVANSWKSGLYQSTVGHAAYLGQVLHEWAADHNRHPDLASRVNLYPREGIGTLLLTSTQEAALRRRLSRLDLRGRVAVDVEDPLAATRPPGGPLGLTVGRHRVEVPADPERPPPPVDPGPTIFVLAAILMGADVVSFPEAILPIVPIVACALGAAWWAHVRLRDLGRGAWPAIMRLAVVVALTYTAVGTLSLRGSVNVGGMENYPVAPSLDLLCILAALYWANLRSGTRGVVVVAGPAVMLTAWLLHPIGDQPGVIVLQALWSLAILATALPVARQLELSSGRYARRLADDGAATEAAAFHRGRASVVDLVRRARDEAEGRVEALGAALAPDLADRVRQSLHEVDQRLAKLALPVE